MEITRARAHLANESSVLKANETDRKQIVAVNGWSRSTYSMPQPAIFCVCIGDDSFQRSVEGKRGSGGGRQISTFFLSVKKNVEYKIALQKGREWRSAVIASSAFLQICAYFVVIHLAYTASTGHGERERRGALNAAQTLYRVCLC